LPEKSKKKNQFYILTLNEHASDSLTCKFYNLFNW